MDQLLDIVLRFSRRERRLLALLALVLLMALLWLGMIAPLLERGAQLRRQAQQAQALQLWLVDRAADQLQLGQAQDRKALPPIGISGLEKSLVTAQLRTVVSQLSGQGDGAIELVFETVLFTDLAAWLSQMDPGWGYDIARLRLQRLADPGLVAAELSLEPQQSP